MIVDQAATVADREGFGARKQERVLGNFCGLEPLVVREGNTPFLFEVSVSLPANIKILIGFLLFFLLLLFSITNVLI